MASAATVEDTTFSDLAARQRHPAVDATIKIVQSPVGAGSGVVILILIAVALLAPYVSPFDPQAISRDKFVAPGEAGHWLGSDGIGRDILTRIMYGARISLYVGFLTVGFGTLAGAVIGLFSGFAGGWIDLVIQRVVDAIQSFPAILLAMAIVSVIGPSTTNGVLAIALIVAVNNSRVIRGAVLSVKENTYIEAARAIGASPLRVMMQHILPNVVAPILILVSAGFGSAILIEGALSFLGLATQPPDASWGLMLSRGRESIETSPWLALFPGLAIAVTVLSFNLLGDVVRDVLDPRLRGSR